MIKPELCDKKVAQTLLANFPTMVLASNSANRTALLEEIGIKVIKRPQDILEFCDKTTPEEVVKELALNKLQSYLSSKEFDPALPSLSADTLVFNDDTLTGKPKDREDAFNTLLSFSNKTQLILSGFALYIPNREIINKTDITTVKFKTLTPKIVNAYLDTEEWIGAAGSYKIQKNGYTLIEKMTGSWSNAIGLSLELLSSSIL